MIPVRPRIHVRGDVGRVGVLAAVDAAAVLDRLVLDAVEFGDRDGQAAGLARWQLLRRLVEVKRARDGRECCDAC